ncbi:MAG: hypothetical protein AB7T86_10165 [Xanthobacteraceae bacterium]|uniref:hypothetical protein n=1 Tax=Pseudolabrys sp. TaxID=1960880 RepID=UPI003D0DF1EB
MILESIVGLSIIVSASLETRPSIDTEPPPPALSVRQRDAALLPLVQRATECILHGIAAGPRELDRARAEEIDGLIVEAMFGCRRQLRAVVNAHDRMYGDGSGEAFVRGPFMDVLPAAVVQQARMRAGAR